VTQVRAGNDNSLVK